MLRVQQSPPPLSPLGEENNDCMWTQAMTFPVFASPQAKRPYAKTSRPKSTSLGTTFSCPAVCDGHTGTYVGRNLRTCAHTHTRAHTPSSSPLIYEHCAKLRVFGESPPGAASLSHVPASQESTSPPPIYEHCAKLRTFGESAPSPGVASCLRLPLLLRIFFTNL